MTREERARCILLTRASKTGSRLSGEEFSFLEAMHNLHPREYGEVCEETRRWSLRLMNPLAGGEDE